jgi:ubiquinone/menaquinone biosynthesis C-methylase UbiE
MTVSETPLPPMEHKKRHPGQTQRHQSGPELPSSTVYSEEYFLSGACEGLSEFLNGELSAVKRREFAFLRVRPGERVLDLGCGRGEAAAELLRMGALPVALDYSASAVRLTHALLEGRSLVVQAGANALPFPAATFDRVLMGDVIEHLPWNMGIEALREIERVLVPGGQALIHSSPNVWFVTLVMRPLRAVMERLGHTQVVNRFNEYERLRHAMHVNELSPRSIGTLMRQAGVQAETWVDRDILRAGDSEWTSSLVGSRVFRSLARIGGLWPLRLVLGNDLYARVTTSTPGSPAPAPTPPSPW